VTAKNDMFFQEGKCLTLRFEFVSNGLKVCVTASSSCPVYVLVYGVGVSMCVVRVYVCGPKRALHPLSKASSSSSVKICFILFFAFVFVFRVCANGLFGVCVSQFS